MKRFIEGEDRSQSTLFPEKLDDYIAQDNAVRGCLHQQARSEQAWFYRLEPSMTG